MREEDNILRKVGTENPFRVPEGYFDRLTSDVMKALPEKETKPFARREPTRWEKVKPWVYMAAMFAGAALLIRVASSDRPVVADPVVVDETEQELADIASSMESSMLDDYTMYLYLTDADID